LIKEFAQVFKTRIEMKQVGFRQEASRLAELVLVEENCVVQLG
jgi:cell fate regulator YaaT (PSP1 superfamily)